MFIGKVGCLLLLCDFRCDTLFTGLMVASPLRGGE